jgi:hypothetical protein
MYTSLDENTFYLNQYEHNKLILEQQWENTMQEKQEAVVELTIKLIKREVDDELFNWVFSEYADDEDFLIDLEAIAAGITPDWSRSQIILDTLEGSCQSLYDCELDEILVKSRRAVIEEVLRSFE